MTESDAAPAPVEAARDWLAQDPDDTTRAELQDLIARAERGEQDAVAEIADRFSGRLAFGTAGLRAELGAGPMRMNRVVVAQAAAGLAAFLVDRALASGVATTPGDPGGERPSVVIGYDGRTNSDVFALDTAELMAGAGVRALLFPHPVPTPVLAFAVRHTGASAGVMVTASHNPPRDNGYKVYLGDADAGSQIVPPADAEIAARIAAAGDVRALPRASDWERAPEEFVDEYVRQTVGSAPRPMAQPRVVYTAMHGVGWPVLRAVLQAAGFDEPAVVPEQIEPDPAFPTVAFPNPEEPGALDLALRTARERDADLVLANDPDADRLAIALPSADADGGWRRLTGNEVGILLGWAAASDPQAHGRTLAASLVSSPALERIAAHAGLDYRQTLTGFKWISRAPDLRFGYEEALGYLVDPQKVRDKDGISAALAALRLAARLAAEGRTIPDLQREIDTAVGAAASSQVSLRVSDLSEIPRITAALRAETPAEIGGLRVTAFDDFARGVDGFAPSDILRYSTERGGRVIVRPSGTEPKLKAYIDAVADQGGATERRAEADAVVAALEAGVRELIAGV